MFPFASVLDFLPQLTLHICSFMLSNFPVSMCITSFLIVLSNFNICIIAELCVMTYMSHCACFLLVYLIILLCHIGVPGTTLLPSTPGGQISSVTLCKHLSLQILRQHFFCCSFFNSLMHPRGVIYMFLPRFHHKDGADLI